MRQLPAACGAWLHARGNASPPCGTAQLFSHGRRPLPGGLSGPLLASPMPIYEYECPKCHKVFEEWVSLSQAHGQEPCPDCGTPSPRLISHTSFVLKGGGWYVSDYGYRKGIKEGDSSSSGSAEKSTSGAQS